MVRKGQFEVVFEPVFASEVIRSVDRKLQRVADKEVTVLLVGESGTGKDVLARRLHERSLRRDKPFVPINCAAIPESLFESELFGHERGAFTGAFQTARGKVEAARGGTLFLDEIGELPLTMQVKLLRFLEHGRFMRVGGTTKLDADIRLVCATLRPLEEDVRRGSFRADLFYRIQGITLGVPPLRERRADVAPLIRQFMAQICAKHRCAQPVLTREAVAALRAHDWPGNVRELRNVIEQVCLLRSGRRVRLRDLPASLVAADGERLRTPRSERPRLAIDLRQPLDAIVDEVIRTVVEREGGNKSRAAERLQIGLRTVQRRLAGQ